MGAAEFLRVRHPMPTKAIVTERALNALIGLSSVSVTRAKVNNANVYVAVMFACIKLEMQITIKAISVNLSDLV
jgi:hypothetical protein